MRGLTATTRRNRHKGWTVCRRCRTVVDNATMVECVRPARTRGAWYCAGCAVELTGGRGDERPVGRAGDDAK